MGVQTLKHVALLAAGLVGAVLLIQGTGSTISVPGSDTGGITFAASTTSSTSVATTASASIPLGLAAPSTESIASSDAAAAKVAAPERVSTGAAVSSARTASVSATSDASTTERAPIHTLISESTVPAPTPTCPAAIGGSTAGAPSAVSANDIPGTSTADLNAFAAEYNSIRVANCLTPIPFANIRYSSCLQDRMFWMADDPSTNPLSAWGHTGSAVRSDGLPIVGCDGDLAGGSGYTAATVASLWWASIDHRDSLYQPSYKGSFADVCIYFAISHGGYNVPAPNEPFAFTRAAAYWASC